MRILLLITTLAAIGCGPLNEQVAHATEDFRNALDDAVDAAQTWIDEPQLQQRESQCHRENGTWAQRVEVEACQNGWAAVNVDGQVQQQPCNDGAGGVYDHQCVHKTVFGWVYFNDGPSYPTWMQAATGTLDVSWDIGRWNTLFWPAAVNHDYCYHHNDITRGFTHKQCDEQMLADLSAVCAQTDFHSIAWFDVDVCRRHAAAMFAAVRCAGSDAFAIMNTRVGYPSWRPLWQQYGMDHDVTDKQLADQVEEYMKLIPQ